MAAVGGEMKNKSATGPIKETRSRRSFLSMVWGGLGLLATAEFLWVGSSFFGWRKSRKKTGDASVIEVGKAGDFTPGSVVAFRQGGFYLSRLESGEFIALSSRCTHLGCVVSWNPTTHLFECPCHSSTFNLKGEVTRAPAPRPLDYFPVTIENQNVKVFVGRKIRRDRFHSIQVTNA